MSRNSFLALKRQIRSLTQHLLGWSMPKRLGLVGLVVSIVLAAFVGLVLADNGQAKSTATAPASNEEARPETTTQVAGDNTVVATESQAQPATTPQPKTTTQKPVPTGSSASVSTSNPASSNTQPTAPTPPVVPPAPCAKVVTTQDNSYGVSGAAKVRMPAGCTSMSLTLQTTDGTSTDWLAAWGGFEWADGQTEKPMAPVMAVLPFNSTPTHHSASLTYKLRSRADAQPGEYEVAFYMRALDMVTSVRVVIE